jgi:hypothetical protein
VDQETVKVSKRIERLRAEDTPYVRENVIALREASGRPRSIQRAPTASKNLAIQ